MKRSETLFWFLQFRKTFYQIGKTHATTVTNGK